MTNFEFDIGQKINRKNSIKSNMPRLIGTVGEVSTTFDLTGQDVSRSCGVTFQNKQFIFGCGTKVRQILQIDACGLKNIGSTPFDHDVGACGSTDDVLVLCFNKDAKDNKRCRQATSPSGPWTQLALSTYDHHHTSIASSPGD